jgi:hypothetical protein
MSRVFISYRRNDTQADTGRLHDTLVAHLGAEALFMDVADLEFGANWKHVVYEALSDAVVMLFVMGPQWRLSEAIKFELEAALSSNIKIVPVLVRGAKIDEVTRDLPEELGGIRDLHAITLDHDLWHPDCTRLADRLKKVLEDPSSPKIRLDKPPDPKKLLDCIPTDQDRDGLLAHARDLAECLDDPSIWQAARREHATFYDELIQVGETRLATTVKGGLARLRVELSIEKFLSRRPNERGAEYELYDHARKLAEYLDDPSVATQAKDELDEFYEELSEIRRTRGDIGNPREPQKRLNNIVDAAMDRLAKELPGITKRYPDREWH